MLYTGVTLTERLDGRPLDHTHDFVDLGYGQRYVDWDLPRMVVTCLVAVPRAAVLTSEGSIPSSDGSAGAWKTRTSARV
ncbi:hypothetical protein [Saccharomonospora sp. CUA-673]|uniref:hypothetical protein n=1 Tax=Saccharomonospora sp. CUA-673 TaxID=1904969 RepID=UPI002100FC4F|nr:hypothetical protein [Saccharomonospora sp. CUA-673]